MADLIEREALLSKIEPDEYYHSNEVRDMLRDCPTITPESLVKHGRWIGGYQNNGNLFWYEKPHCSLCGVRHDGIANYCPNCGAKMDLKE